MPKLSRETATALKIATVYAVVGGAYIFASSGYIATSAISKESLALVEVWKGLGFIVVTTAILFGSVALTLKRRSERDRLIAGVFNAIDDAVLLIDRRSLRVLDCSASTRSACDATGSDCCSTTPKRWTACAKPSRTAPKTEGPTISRCR